MPKAAAKVADNSAHLEKVSLIEETGRCWTTPFAKIDCLVSVN